MVSMAPFLYKIPSNQGFLSFFKDCTLVSFDLIRTFVAFQKGHGPNKNTLQKMKKILFFGAAALVAFASCGNKTATSSEMADSTATADSTVFAGELPMADGTDTVTLTLKDGTFVRTHGMGMAAENGTYSTDDQNIMTTVAGQDTVYYAVTADSLTMLGMDKKPAASGLPYVLKKVK